MIDYGDGIIESDILSDGDDSSSELVPSELLTEAAFGFMAAILGGEDVTVGMTMGDTERLRSGFVASRILSACRLSSLVRGMSTLRPKRGSLLGNVSQFHSASVFFSNALSNRPLVLAACLAFQIHKFG